MRSDPLSQNKSYRADNGEVLAPVGVHDLEPGMRMHFRDAVSGRDAFFTVANTQRRGERTLITFEERVAFRTDRPVKPMTSNVAATEQAWVAEASLPAGFVRTTPTPSIGDLPPL